MKIFFGLNLVKSIPQKGFTLLEVILAITVLTLAIGGSFTLISQTLASISVVQSKLIASYLIQEGIEIVKNIRDTNWLKNQPWDKDITATTNYQLDYRSTTFPDDSNCYGKEYLKFDGNFYSCSLDSDSKFQRQITIEKPEPDEMRVKVLVIWKERGKSHSITAQEYLYNWTK